MIPATHSPDAAARPPWWDGARAVLRKEQRARRSLKIGWHALLWAAFVAAYGRWADLAATTHASPRMPFTPSNDWAALALFPFLLLLVAMVLPAAAGSVAREREQGGPPSW